MHLKGAKFSTQPDLSISCLSLAWLPFKAKLQDLLFQEASPDSSQLGTISQPPIDIYLSNTYIEFDLDLNQIGWQYELHKNCTPWPSALRSHFISPCPIPRHGRGSLNVHWMNKWISLSAESDTFLSSPALTEIHSTHYLYNGNLHWARRKTWLAQLQSALLLEEPSPKKPLPGLWSHVARTPIWPLPLSYWSPRYFTSSATYLSSGYHLSL